MCGGRFILATLRSHAEALQNSMSRLDKFMNKSVVINQHLTRKMFIHQRKPTTKLEEKRMPQEIKDLKLSRSGIVKCWGCV